MKEAPGKKYFRLAPGCSVRLKSAYIITCDGFDEDENGNVTTVYASYHADSKSGSDTSGIKAKGTIHWVSCQHAFDAEVRLYDRLFNDENPDGHKDREFMEFLNPDSLSIVQNCKLEPGLASAKPGDGFQFQRLGYFSVDNKYSLPGKPVFNRTVTLKDGWKK